MNAYRDDALRTAAICFSHWNRDPASPSCGCFDRSYWGWKKKDFPDAALQAAITLCVRLAESEGDVASLPALADGWIGYLERIQHRDGSFDQFYPHEKAPGVLHDVLPALISLWRGPHVDARGKARIEAMVRHGLDYSLKFDETHGDIANHFAQFAWEYANAGHVFTDDRATRRSRDYLARTLALFDKDEGWFREYDGADAGYQTRTLAYLTRLASLTGDEELWNVCARGARFVETMLMPDDSLHPMLGVRSTALIYPSGFERLATRFPDLAPLAERIHASWRTGTTPLPSVIDLENGIRIAEDAFDAADLRDARRGAAQPSTGATAEWQSFDLPRAGLHRRAMPQEIMYVSSHLGGPFAIYTQVGESWRLAHEDSGYLLHLNDDSRWLVRRAGAGRPVEVSANRIVIEAGFQRSLHDDLTPFRMVVLRLLNLTVLRSQVIGDLFRRIVVRRLISGTQSLPIRFRREIEVADAGVAVTDRLSAVSSLSSRLNGARLYRCRRVTGNHMASSRYFQPQEIVGGTWTEELPIDVLDGRPLPLKIETGSR